MTANRIAVAPCNLQDRYLLAVNFQTNTKVKSNLWRDEKGSDDRDVAGRGVRCGES